MDDPSTASDNKNIKLRRIIFKNGLHVSSRDQCILITDSGCDQSIINVSAFRVLSQSGIYYDLNGALVGRMKSSTALEVVDGATLATFQDRSKVILIMNQALLDTHPGQKPKHYSNLTKHERMVVWLTSVLSSIKIMRVSPVHSVYGPIKIIFLCISTD